MGLDMYLTKRIYVGAYFEHLKVNGKIELFKDETPIDVKLERVSEISERVGYWRKANHIHRWFVENVQDGKDDCGDYEVSTDDLKTLLAMCKEAIENKQRADGILPTQRGFFFGGTDYDEYYFQDLEDTIKICEQAIAEDGDYYYHSSW